MNFRIITLGLLMMLPYFAKSQGCGGDTESDGVKVIGYIQPQYEYQFLGDSVQKKFMNGLSSNSSFYFNRIRFGVQGNVPYDFSYYMVAELSPSKGGPEILDAFVTYNRWAPYAKISFGQFKMPFGLELSTACNELNTVDRSRVVNELASPFRDFGVMVLGGNGEKKLFGIERENWIKWYFALTNGVNLNMMDDNSDKTFTSRILLNPWEWLKMGASFRYGNYASISGGADDSRRRFGADLTVQKWNLTLQGEYIHGYDKGSSLVGGGCGVDPTIKMGTFTKSGYWGALMYKTKFNLAPIVKYQHFQSYGKLNDGTVNEFNQQEYIVGLNYYFNDWTRFQLNYVITKDSQIHSGPDFMKNFLVTQVQIKFN